ncbi:hypothetical protein N0V93_001176 [Gnomoniopsis smithogilvyi]|uniref:Uncharacterized protein n=1 Tax=Gnomoniopsis smithogilvyi TaxID=1191159 RepID=A0A9W8Z3E2_9PEZI|nr:hypothetical protein N0V93_001176 [Gnomoniopsis smithogilvyi]
MSTSIKTYPGLGLPVRFLAQSDQALRYRNQPPTFPLGSHPNILGSTSILLPVREVAMMAIMDRLTDKPEWHRKVFDEAIVSKWKDEALAIPDEELMKVAAAPRSGWDKPRMRKTYKNGQVQLVEESPQKVVGIMSEQAFDYCVKELRSKASYYEKSGMVPTLDASATVVKSDILVKAELRDSLKKAFEKVQNDQKNEPDWHPNSGDMVQDLVHPSMFPLVYGRSNVLRDESVTVIDAIEKWAGKGEVIPKVEEPSQRNNASRWQTMVSLGNFNIPAEYWSTSYQWLPSNVSFLEDGGVKLTSYINNLHPKKYSDVYATIERLIEKAIPAWDQCLLEYAGSYQHRGPGRKGSRFSVPEDADDEIEKNWLPSIPGALAGATVDISEDGESEDDEDEEEDQDRKTLRIPVLREPDPFKEVEYDLSKVDKASQHSPETLSMSSQVHFPGTTIVDGLREKFKDSGLQVIVKMASIELTPEKPQFPAGGWHIEGLMNERICATALYYLDSENITDSSLSFRMQTSHHQTDLQDQVGQDSYRWLECNYGTRLSVTNGSCIQNYGSVNTCEGRLLAFPNVFQHRVSPFELVDKQKPGHRRFIALWLVDPHLRIISTANVPPQQEDWWVESVFGASANEQKAAAKKLPAEVVQLLRDKGMDLPSVDDDSKGVKLPNEVLEMVRKELNLGIFTMQEAKEHRLALMAERTTQQVNAEIEWLQATYSFCEH